MTPQQIVALGVRLFAVWLGLANLGWFLGALLSPMSFNGRLGLFYGLVGETLMMIAAIALWMFPMTVAHKIIPRTKFENTIQLSALESARVGCALVGLFVFVTVLPIIARLVIMAIVQSGPSSVVSAFSADQKIMVVVTLIQIGLALLLIFGSAGFAKMVLRQPSASGEEGA